MKKILAICTLALVGTVSGLAQTTAMPLNWYAINIWLNGTNPVYVAMLPTLHTPGETAAEPAVATHTTAAPAQTNAEPGRQVTGKSNKSNALKTTTTKMPG